MNPDQIEQVFLNLLLNALDAMPEGGDLRVTMRRQGPEVVVRVEDTGRGIDPEALDRVFDPFFTTKPLGKGTGLGLSICYGTVRDHGGTITVESTKGRGRRSPSDCRSRQHEILQQLRQPRESSHKPL